MKVEKFLKFAAICLLVLAVFALWFAACASGNNISVQRGLSVDETNIEVFPQLGHNNAINSVAFSPYGKQALSGSNDRTIKLWDQVTAVTGA